MTPEEKIIERLGAENGKLRSRVEVLEYRISNLIGRDGTKNRLGLTQSEYRLTHLMANASPRVVTKEALLEARRPDTQYADDGVHIKIVDVFVCKIRKKLAKFDMTVQTAWGSGYYMTEEDAEKFFELAYPNIDRIAA